MAIKRMDEVLAAIAAGKSNAEIRDEIDGRIGDKAINQLRKHPANADVPWPEDALRYEAEQAARAEAETARAEAAAAEDKVPFTPEPEETAAEEPETESAAPAEEPVQEPEPNVLTGWSGMVENLLAVIDPPMSVASAIRDLAAYAVDGNPELLIEAALAVKERMIRLKGRLGK